MRFKPGLTAKITKQIVSNKIRGKKRFALVLMLEPTFMCNLACEGCGRIREYKEGLNRMMSVDECMKAVDECGAQIVSICGGEPLVYPHIEELISRLTKKGKYIYLCTNGLLFKDKMPRLKPSENLMVNFHIDGLEKTHDAITGLKGAYNKVIEAVKAAKKKGYFVCTNTTIYRQTDINELRQLFKTLHELKVDGFLISPAYGYVHVGDAFFFRKKELAEYFRKLEPEFKKYNFLGSPLYIEFVQGKRDIDCAPWSTPTRNPFGWRSPCYQLADKHLATYKELIEKTDWKKYGARSKNPRCAECAVHCGFEPASVLEGKSFMDIMKLIGWQFT